MTPLNALLVKRNNRIVSIGLVMWLTASVGLADVAVLREKGPWSGSIGSNIGLLAEQSPVTKITMVSAEVKIHLKRGEKDQLKAECTADFVLEDHSEKDSSPQEFLVGFPVTGLNSKTVTVDDFSVEINGEKPATVFRQAIAITRRQHQLKDIKIYGRLAEKYELKPENNQWGIKLTNEIIYPNAYVWSQKSVPKSTIRVRVTYVAILRPQFLHYSKSYESLPTDGEVVPFSNLWVEKWDEPYYLFDYILVSGSTWDGPIGHEKVTFSVEPALALPLRSILGVSRNYVGYSDTGTGRPRMPDGPSEAIDPGEANYDEHGVPHWVIKGEPQYDLLFAIPVSALGTAKPEK